MSNQINIQFFGCLVEYTGCSTLTLDQVKDTLTLDNFLKNKYPQLQTSTYKRAVNNQWIKGEIDLPENASISYMPPFSGG